MSKPRRVAAYSRVSTVLQATDGMSLEQQIHAIKEYCNRQGWPEPVEYVDAGRSAYKEQVKARPAFMRLLADVADGAIDAVIVWHINRWSRRVKVTHTTIDQLTAAGARLVSVSQHLDYTSAMGKFTMTMMAGIAELESDEKSETAKRVHANLRAQGKWDGGSPPYGAMLDPDGKLTLDPAKADALARALALVAAHSYHVAADTLNAEGVPPPGVARRYQAGPPRGWWPTSLRNAIVGGKWLLDQPDPWPARYLAATARPAPLPVARARTIRTLTGLPRCHACGHAVVYTYTRARDDLRVRCETPGCKLGYGRADRHERAVLAAVAALRPRERPLAPSAPSAPDARAWSAIAEQRRRYAAMFGQLRIDEATYEASLAELDAREAQLTVAGTPARDLSGVAAVLPHLALLPEAEVNGVLRQLIARVVMAGKDERRIIWRPDAAAAFTGCG